ncbi:AAA family ATPase [Burkholderia pseudomallei]|uniref:AAA family ATPase n=1 Tax=Burkholderia pseudomallei TaxID=28450 RepID=UPI000E70F7D8|nr:AAA family ATPase [Burkholderia pseudomallei]AYE29321.1 AAA family ATPase [Burkholderia pseudomallei]MBF3778992.1 AAA family ATPase [Burkholderia pseudomallei]MBF4060252.1 AAA family ATPase [Burkholderia pseudomallei]MBF4078350.1 AAA family ATPase [Burkholderia pseudomallei]
MARMIPDTIDFDAYLRGDDDGRAKVRPASEFADDVVRLIHGDGEQDIAGAATPWPKVENRLRFRSGEVTLWAGVNGHGKSALLGYVVLNTLVAGARACIASLEMSPPATLGRMCRQAAGGNAPTPEWIRRFHVWTDDRLWLYAHQGQVHADRMLAVARYCRKELGIDHVVIDSVMKCGMAPDDYGAQKNFVDALCALARDTGLHVHLVHHIRKGESEKAIPDKFDIKGAGEIVDLVDNALIVYRNKRKETQLENATDPQKVDELAGVPDTVLICEKQRHFSWEGRINLWFDRDSQQLLEHAKSARRYIDFSSNGWKTEWRR